MDCRNEWDDNRGKRSHREEHARTEAGADRAEDPASGGAVLPFGGTTGDERAGNEDRDQKQCDAAEFALEVGAAGEVRDFFFGGLRKLWLG